MAYNPYNIDLGFGAYMAQDSKNRAEAAKLEEQKRQWGLTFDEDQKVRASQLATSEQNRKESEQRAAITQQETEKLNIVQAGRALDATIAQEMATNPNQYSNIPLDKRQEAAFKSLYSKNPNFADVVEKNLGSVGYNNVTDFDVNSTWDSVASPAYNNFYKLQFDRQGYDQNKSLAQGMTSATLAQSVFNGDGGFVPQNLNGAYALTVAPLTTMSAKLDAAAAARRNGGQLPPTEQTQITQPVLVDPATTPASVPAPTTVPTETPLRATPTESEKTDSYLAGERIKNNILNLPSNVMKGVDNAKDVAGVLLDRELAKINPFSTKDENGTYVSKTGFLGGLFGKTPVTTYNGKTTQEWQELVDKHKKSGATDAEFTLQNGVTPQKAKAALVQQTPAQTLQVTPDILALATNDVTTPRGTIAAQQVLKSGDPDAIYSVANARMQTYADSIGTYTAAFKDKKEGRATRDLLANMYIAMNPEVATDAEKMKGITGYMRSGTGVAELSVLKDTMAVAKDLLASQVTLDTNEANKRVAAVNANTAAGKNVIEAAKIQQKQTELNSTNERLLFDKAKQRASEQQEAIKYIAEDPNFSAAVDDMFASQQTVFGNNDKLDKNMTLPVLKQVAVANAIDIAKNVLGGVNMANIVTAQKQTISFYNEALKYDPGFFEGWFNDFSVNANKPLYTMSLLSSAAPDATFPQIAEATRTAKTVSAQYADTGVAAGYASALTFYNFNEEAAKKNIDLLIAAKIPSNYYPYIFRQIRARDGNPNAVITENEAKQLYTVLIQKQSRSLLQ